MIARTLNSDRRQLSVEQRREVVALREEGHSQRAIAGALGVSQKTVRNDLQVSTPTHLAEEPSLTEAESAKRTVVPAKSTREADQLTDVGKLVPAEKVRG